MAILNREAFASKCKRRFSEVPLPGGDTVRIQSINELERSELRAGNWRKTTAGLEMDPDKYATQGARLIQLCVVDEAGQRAFSTWQEAGELDATLSEQLETACRSHCGLDKEADTKALEKNSEPTGA